MTSDNKSLRTANKNKEDEFYTELSDIENELKHYKRHFKGKRVLCNCDDPRISKFFHYFSYNFEHLGLKKLTATCYKSMQTELFSRNKSRRAAYLEYTGRKGAHRTPKKNEIGIRSLKGDGDFKSDECIALLKKCDIVVTNPPFSLFREYVDQLVRYKKKFIIIGSQNNVSYKEIFKLLKSNKVWLGNYSGDMNFRVPSHYTPRKTRYWKDKSGQKWRSLGTMCWFTNLDIARRHERLICYKKFNKKDYPLFDNYDAISVNKVVEIPANYRGRMGVPITFMNKYNPKQFQLIGIDEQLTGTTGKKSRFYIKGKRKYARIVIRRTQNGNRSGGGGK